jgi:hypothetical protein
VEPVGETEQAKPYFGAEEAISFLEARILAQCLNIHVWSPSFIKQELARFSNDQRFVYYEHVVAGVMQFDDSRVLHA